MNKVASRWSNATRKAFLDALAASADVRQAARAAGRTYAAACALRRHDATFGDRWDEALLVAYARLETELLARAIGVAVEDGDRFDPVLALKMLLRHEARHAARAGRRGSTPHTASIEEVERSLTRKLAALGKRMPKAS